MKGLTQRMKGKMTCLLMSHSPSMQGNKAVVVAAAAAVVAAAAAAVIIDR